jgi:hypothetical protein
MCVYSHRQPIRIDEDDAEVAAARQKGATA